MTYELVSTSMMALAVLRMSSPPLNAVASGLRRQMAADLARIDEDSTVDAVLLIGAPGVFATSLPVAELEAPVSEISVPGAPSLAALCSQIESLSKPVIACLDGHVAGAGMDLALAAHVRVALPNARLGFPDLHVGLCPSGGATQRLPRLIGADRALGFLLGATPYPAHAPICAGLIDRLARDRSLQAEGIAMAEALHDGGLWVRTRDRLDGFDAPRDYAAAIATWRKRSGEGRPDLQRIIDLVEAAPLLEFQAGLAKEEAAHEDLRDTARSRGLRRARHSEQRCTALTEGLSGGCSGADPRGLSVAITPATVAGGRIAGAAALAGVSSRLFDADEARALQILGDTRFHLTRHAEARGTSGDPAGRVTALRDPRWLAEAQVVFVTFAAEGTADPAEAWAQRLAELTPHLGPETVVLCVDAGRDCAALAPSRIAARVIGVTLPDMDFTARLAELSVGPQTDPQAMATASALLQRMGRVVVPGPQGASLTMRLFDNIMATTDRLVQAGVAPVAFAQAAQVRGHARGPLELLAQVAQVDPRGYLARASAAGRGGSFTSVLLRDGIAVPRGGRSSPLADQLAARLAGGRSWSPLPEVLASAFTLAIVNEGCRLIADGRADEAEQIDVVMLQGWGYARHTGGPMSKADQMGAARLVQLSEHLVRMDPALWTPHPILADMARVPGARFIDPAGQGKPQHPLAESDVA